MLRFALRRLQRDRHFLISLAVVLVLIGAGVCFPLPMLLSGQHVMEQSLHQQAQGRVQTGYFETLVELDASELAALEGEGTTLEPHLSLDFEQADGSILRVTPLREHIDRQQVVRGQAPQSHEILVERNYAQQHGLEPGQGLVVAGLSLRVSGSGVSPDYELPLNQLSDVEVDAQSFGIAWVDQATYEDLKQTHQSREAQRKGYAFRLEGKRTEAEFREQLKDLSLSLDELTDPVLKQRIAEQQRPLKDLQQSSATLMDQSQAYQAALHQLDGLRQQLGQLPPASPWAQGAGAIQQIQAGGQALTEGTQAFLRALNTQLDETTLDRIPNLTFYLHRKNNPRIHAAYIDAELDVVNVRLSQFLIFFICAYAMTLLIGQTIEREKSVLGTLSALGIPRYRMALAYGLGPAVLSALAGAIGLAIAFPARFMNEYAEKASYYSLPDPTFQLSYKAYLYAIVAPFVIAYAVNFFFIWRRLQASTLALIKNEPKQAQGLAMRLRPKRGSFRFRFLLNQLGRAFRMELVMAVALFSCLLMVSLALHIHFFVRDYQRAVDETPYEYLYLYRYPSESLEAEAEGGTPAYVQTLYASVQDHSFAISAIGIDPDNPFFPEIGSLEAHQIALSKPVADKFKLQPGDFFILENPLAQRHEAYEVVRITPYTGHLAIFMTPEFAASQFGHAHTFNALFSRKALSVPEAERSAVLETAHLRQQASRVVALMKPLIQMLEILSVLVLCAMLFLLLKLLIERSRQTLSLLKILGYSDQALLRLFLLPQWGLLMILSAGLLPLAKVTMDQAFPQLVVNMAWLSQITYPWFIYIGIYLGVVGVSGLVVGTQYWALKRVPMGEVLKNRE